MKAPLTVLAALTLNLSGTLAASAADMPRCGSGATAGASAPMGDCHIAMHDRPARAHGRWGADYTPGWMLMTPQERKSFVEKMREAGSREECMDLIAQQRAEIETRAKATGQRLPHEPSRRACAAFPRKPEAEHHTHN